MAVYLRKMRDDRSRLEIDLVIVTIVAYCK